MPGIEFIRDLGIIVLVAAVAGWLCRRAGLSVVVGYLVAGIVVGPFTPPFKLVTDSERIHTLAQLGLVFLMFGIGLHLSLHRLRSLGLGVVAATAVGAVVVFNLARWLAVPLGFSPVQSLFFAGMFVVSSSAVVTKVLAETGRLHARAGQTALAISVLEDVVAVTVLAVLNAYVQVGAGRPQVGETLGLLGAFVTLLTVVGLLFVPRLLRGLANAGEELQTLTVAGLLFALAYFAERAGYSLALGSFLLGAIVAGTPQRGAIERSIAGLRDLFSAVFFVAIGMLIDPRVFGEIWWQVLIVAAAAIAIRVFSVSLGMLAAGRELREAVPTGLLVTPLGEFSLIIAQLGVTAHVLPDTMQPLAVGAVLLTALTAPWLARRAEGAGEFVEKHGGVLHRLLGEYQSWLSRIEELGTGSVLWQLSRKRLLQIGVGVLLVTGLLVFVPALEQNIVRLLELDQVLPRAARLVFWSGLGVVVLAIVLAIWRNAGALALIYAEVTTQGLPNSEKLRPVVYTGIRLGVLVAIVVWLATIIPLGPWAIAALVVSAAVAVALLWRRLVYWHSAMEVRLHDSLNQSAPAGGAAALAASAGREWDVAVDDFALPDNSAAAGRTVGQLGLRQRLGCTIVAVERRGVCLTSPTPDTALFPDDRLLLLGTPAQLSLARAELTTAHAPESATKFSELVLQRVKVPAASPRVARTLAELAPARATGVQIAGIRRGEARTLSPGGAEYFEGGDELLVLGTPEQLVRFRKWLRGENPAGTAEPAPAPG